MKYKLYDIIIFLYLDIDFNELFTTKSSIINAFEKYSEDLLKIIDLNIKDHDGKLLIESIKKDSDNISQSNFSILYNYNI